MNLNQQKLSKSEWDSVEIPVSEDEATILKLIISGFADVNIKTNKTNSLLSFLKIEYSPQMEDFLYNKHFATRITSLLKDRNITYVKISNDNNKFRQKRVDEIGSDEEKERGRGRDVDGNTIWQIKICALVKLKSCDQIRIGRSDAIDETKTEIYDFILIKHLELMLSYKTVNNKIWIYHYYTLINLMQNNIEKVNCHVMQIVSAILENIEKDIELIEIVKNAYEYIERNASLLKYGDMQLYNHQKEIYSVCKIQCPKLVLYIAPTGTGKTLTPLGLSESFKIIFVCAARHVGVALARSAISAGKHIAFAFGCSSADDIRLHYFSALEYTRDRRSGGIRKVDNSVGNKVEIMICDIRSYLCAMYYMLSFNRAQDIITYWDEPTITMDYAEHDLHKVIKKNWKDNIIPNVVLSSATLPKMHEIGETIRDFEQKFADYQFLIDTDEGLDRVIKQPRIFNIASHDCRKTIPILNNNGFTVMPHYISGDYDEILEIVQHCEENLTLLRYFDLNEASKFIMHVEEFNLAKPSARFNRNFISATDITMQSIKMYYLKTLKNMVPEKWHLVHTYFSETRTQKIQPNDTIDPKGNKIAKVLSMPSSMTGYKQGSAIERTASLQLLKPVPATTSITAGTCAIYVTTKDAYTLTDGPTIFLAKDVTKVAKFCIQQANIPASVMKDIQDKIDFNNEVSEKIASIEAELENAQENMGAKTGTGSSDKSNKKEGKKKEKVAGEMIDKSKDKEIIKMREQLAMLSQMIKSATIHDLFVPNRSSHKEKWAPQIATAKAFTSSVNEDDIISIMSLNDVDDSWKVLLLQGIGVFANHKSKAYSEIMKKLADKQLLFLIIADSDYIYGTNYQFCHGYLSKDLGLTQEKIIQALGRIGRNNIQQEYSARFRDDEQIKTLFTRFASADKPEVLNMNMLFNSRNVKWNGQEYEEFADDDVDVVSREEDLEEEDEC